MNTRGLWLISLGAALALASDMAAAEPVVQAVPGSGASSLNAALSRLARNPRDIDALIAAGDAALALGDNGAAAGFFARADALAPNNGAVLAGLAAAKVRGGDPFAAIPLFDTAEKVGAIAPERLADRGLAYDLVGDNTRAQTWYRQAMAGGASDEAARRLGLSQAIAGDRRGAEATLSPLLQKNDRAAWRARAFALAILGREDEAVSIAQSTMPAPLATAIAPYLRYMRQLTPAQQAGAANLGRFPRAAEIGHDDPRVAAFAPRTRLAANDAALVPAGKPLGTAAPAEASPPPPKPRRKPKPVTPPPKEAEGEVRAAAPPRTAPPDPMPSRSAASEPVQLAVASPPPRPAPRPEPVTAAPPPKPAPAPAPAVAAPAPAPAPVASAPAPVASPPPPVSQPAPKPAPPPAAKPPVAKPGKPSFAEAFGAFGEVNTAAVPARGAVDIRKITPTRPKPPPPPPPPPVPSRIWVQVGVGRDTGRLAFTWRKMQQDDPALFKGHKAWFTGMGRTNRMVVGPFANHEAAEAFLKKAKAANYNDAYIWNSPVGEVLDPVWK